jgi:uncharacterized repeat protein (TIGR01451 family)
VIPPGVLEFEDAEVFRPTTDGGDFVTVYDSDTLPPRKFHLGVYGDYARNPLEVRFVRSGETFTRIVRNLGTLQLSGAFGLAEGIELGARLPAYVQSVKDLQAPEASLGGTDANFGDLTLNGKFTLLPRSRHGIGVAALPEVILPTGNRREFAGTGSLGWGGLLILDAAPTERLLLAANFGGLVRDEVGGGPFEDRQDRFNDQLRYGVAAAYRFDRRFTGIAELYGGADTASPFDKERKTPLDLIGALRVHVGPVDLTAGGGGGLTIGQGSPDFRLFVGIATPQPKREVQRPVADLSRSAKTYQSIDRDGDGRTSPGDVLEYRIHLVNSGPAAATQVVVEDPIPDRTRYVPGSLRVEGRIASDAADGDPAEYLPGPPARAVFRVPRLDPPPGKNTAELSFQVEIDPNITEIATIVNQAVVSAQQIPPFPLPPTSTTVFPRIAERERVIVGPEKIELTEQIHFEFDKAVIQRRSYPILRELAEVLQEYPDLRVRIEGHTDAVGTESYNQRLSERRALAVRDFLVGLGIAPERLEWVGYGESRPIASNDTPAGRAKNRRTEFPVLNPEALQHRVIQRKPPPTEDLAPQSEPPWLREKGFRE